MAKGRGKGVSPTAAAPGDPQGRATRVLIGLALAGLTLMVYGQCVSFQFTSWDDGFFITDNPVVQEGISVRNLAWAVTAVTAGTWQPVTWISHMLDCQLFGLQPGGHHLVNVLLHLANTLLVFWLLNRWTASNWRSALVAALFALHPLHVESVAWMAERRDVLSTLWWLLTLWFYAEWVKRRGWPLYLAVMVCLSLGLMAKPMLVTLPVVLLLLDIWPLKRIRLKGLGECWQQRRPLLGLLVDKLPLLGLALGTGVITIIAVEANGDIGSLTQYPFSLRVANALVSYVRYLYQTIWPFELIPFYPYPPSIPWWQSGGAFLLLSLVTFACLRRLPDLPYLFVGWGWYLITLLPVIGLIQQGTGFALADRYTYVPLLGIFMMVAWGGAALAARYRWPRWWQALASGIVLLGCLAISFQQTSHWQDTKTLFSYTLAVDPENRVALNQLGVEARSRGAQDEAHGFLAKAAALYPQDFDAQAHLASLLDEQGRYEEAISQYRTALRLKPDSVDCFLNMGVIRVKQENLAEAVDHFNQALTLQPNSVKVRMNLGFAWYVQHRLPEAAAEFNKVIALEPGLGEAYNGLGLVSMEQGRVAEAIDHFQTALRLTPDSQQARDNLQDALMRQGAGGSSVP